MITNDMFIKAIQSTSNQAAKVLTLCGFFTLEDHSFSFKITHNSTYALTSRPDQACLYTIHPKL